MENKRAKPEVNTTNQSHQTCYKRAPHQFTKSRHLASDAARTAENNTRQGPYNLTAENPIAFTMQTRADECHHAPHRAYIFIHTCMYVCISIFLLHNNETNCACMYTHVRIYIHIPMRVYVHIHTHMYIYIYIDVHIYTDVHIQVHKTRVYCMYIHMYTSIITT